MTIDKAQLKTLAEAVKQGHWVQDGFDVQDDGVEEYRVANCRSLAEAEFIAAVSPATILALLAEIDQLKLALDMESAELAWSDSDGREQGAENAKLKTELAGLRTGYDAQNNVIADLKAENEALRTAMKDLCAMYTHVWDREDGALVCFSSNVERFDKAHEAAWALLTGKEASHG